MISFVVNFILTSVLIIKRVTIQALESEKAIRDLSLNKKPSRNYKYEFRPPELKTLNRYE